MAAAAISLMWCTFVWLLAIAGGGNSIETFGVKHVDITKGDVQIFAYADKVSRMGCMSIETAILSGWKYNLVGPDLPISYGGGGLNNKIYAMSLVSEVIDGASTIVYADAFDVIYQGSKRDFVSQAKRVSADSSKVVYSAENNCYPFRRVDKNFYCEFMSGADYVNSHVGFHGEGGPFREGDMRPLACAKLDDLVPPKHSETVNRYLNSGLSYGTASYFKQLANATDYLYKNIPPSCQDDQAVLSWLMATKTLPITLDYASALFGSHYNMDYEFDYARCLWRNTQDSSHPSVIHHNGPKHKFAIHRQQLVQCKFKDNAAAYEAFMDKSTFTLNGETKKFSEVCTGEFDPEPSHSAIPNNTPIKGDCSKETYMYQNHTLRFFPSLAVFVSWGLDFSEVKGVSCSIINSIPLGPPMAAKE